jgi:hypothetical protein
MLSKNDARGNAGKSVPVQIGRSEGQKMTEKRQGKRIFTVFLLGAAVKIGIVSA